jgi:hypothetical protein
MKITSIKWPYLAFLLIVLLHIGILSNLIFFPYPELFIYPYLTNHGLIPYKDILDQHFPGLMFLPVNLDNLGMTNEVAARIWHISIISLTQITLFITSLKLFKDPKKALFASFLYLFWQPFFEGWVLWINNFLPLLYLPAFYLTYKFILDKKKEYKKVLIIGILLGIATLFKQVAIPLAGLVFLLLFFYSKNIRTFLYYSFGYLPIPIMMLLYITSKGALQDFWFWSVQYNLTTYAKYGGKPPDVSGLIRVLGTYAPVVFLTFVKDKMLALTLGVFLIGSLSGALHRFDFVHFQPSLPFVVISLVLLFENFKKLNWFKTAVVLYTIMAIVWLTHFYRGHLRHYTYYFDEDTKKTAEVIKSLTRPGEEIFIFGTTPLIYQMSGTIPAGKVFVFQFPWFLMESGDRVMNGLKTSHPKVIVADFGTETQGNKITDFAPEIYKYILDHYHEEYQVGPNKILIKNDQYALKN